MGKIHTLSGFVFLFVFFYGWGQPTAVAEPLRIGIMHFAPFLIVRGNEIGGTELERLKKVLKSQNIEYTVKGFPPKRLYGSLGTGEIDLILSSTNNPDYEKEIIHSAAPIKSIELMVFARKKTHLPKSQNEWINKKFIIINGFGYGGFLKKLELLEKQRKITLYRSNQHSNAIKMLAAGRADYLLNYKMPASREIEKLGLINQLQHALVFKVDIYVLLNRKVENARQILNAIEKGYQQLVQ